MCEAKINILFDRIDFGTMHAYMYSNTMISRMICCVQGTQHPGVIAIDTQQLVYQQHNNSVHACKALASCMSPWVIHTILEHDAALLSTEAHY